MEALSKNFLNDKLFDCLLFNNFDETPWKLRLISFLLNSYNSADFADWVKIMDKKEENIIFLDITGFNVTKKINLEDFLDLFC